MPSRVLTIVTATALLAAGGEVSAAQSCVRDTVSGRQLGDAMREAIRAPGGDYDLLATTNSMRFQSKVFEYLLERALTSRPQGGALFIPYDILWSEFLIVAGLTPGDSSKAPIGRLLAFDYHQSIELVYGPVDGIVRKIGHGSAPPRLAANVLFAWPDRPDGRRKFSFIDTLSVPKIQATNHQVLTLRFLVFDDMTALDDIYGISGRPLTGFLAAIFKVIGEGNAVFARFAISTDGRQVLRTKAAKLISKTVTAVINPDGSADSTGLLKQRLDLREIETRLSRPLELDYYPYRCWLQA